MHQFNCPFEYVNRDPANSMEFESFSVMCKGLLPKAYPMKTLFLVTSEQFDTARRMENTLLDLPEESGIRFVGVEVIASETLPTYKIFIGCTRERDASLMSAIVKQYLRHEVINESQFEITVSRGVDRVTHIIH